MMKSGILAVALAATLLTSCSSQDPQLQIVPQPQSIELSEGSCPIAGVPLVCQAGAQQRTLRFLEAFASRLQNVSGKATELLTLEGEAPERGIVFTFDDKLPAEAYVLEVDSKTVRVSAADHNAVVYAVQTMMQMLPPAVYGTSRSSGPWKLPCCRIEDSPRFGHRGFLLDCCRHFFSVEEVKKCLDIAAVCKLNRFHWHLTEDQGWRIEIKKYPQLTEVGAWRTETQTLDASAKVDGIPHGGFYTQEEIREIVDYADVLGIEILPEIDLPGHMVAALASYPELGCTGGPYSVRTMWGIDDNVLCPGKESTFRFIEGVLDEVVELFPGKYIHIGGDECPKTSWEKCPHCQARIKALGLKSDEKASKEQRLQNYVTARVQDYLATKGRKIVGWDEILEGELAEGATVMSWRGMEPGQAAAKAGYDVIMTPKWFCYLDYCQSADYENEPFGPQRPLPLSKCYSLEPCEGLYGKATSHILGIQGNLWTEWVAEEDHLEYMLLPRLFALGEVAWCQPRVRNYERFLDSVREHEYAVLDMMGFDYKRY